MTADAFDWREEARADSAEEARAERDYLARLWRAPDCRDPDHPGCDGCADREEDPEEVDPDEETET